MAGMEKLRDSVMSQLAEPSLRLQMILSGS